MEIAASSGRNHYEVRECLKNLWRAHIIRYIPSNTSPLIYLDEERLPVEDLYIAPETYSKRKALMMERFENMLHYASNESECRSVVLDRYFGGGDSAACGVCDICLANRKRKGTKPSLEEVITQRVQGGQLSVKDLVSGLGCDPEQAITLVRRMMEEGRISMTAEGLLQMCSKN